MDLDLYGRAAGLYAKEEAYAQAMEVPTADPVRAVVMPTLVERQSVAQPRSG